MSEKQNSDRAKRYGRVRYYIGVLSILILLVIYIPIAIGFSMLFKDYFTGSLQIVYIALIGLLWVILLLPIISWMDKGNRKLTSHILKKNNSVSDKRIILCPDSEDNLT